MDLKHIDNLICKAAKGAEDIAQDIWVEILTNRITDESSILKNAKRKSIIQTVVVFIWNTLIAPMMIGLY